MTHPEVKQHGHDLTAEEIRAMIGDSPSIVEIGCNDGEHTQKFLDAMPKAKIVCFEPSARVLSVFRCQDDPRVKVFPVAIGHRFCELRLFESGGIPDCNTPTMEWNKSSSIVRPTGHLARSTEITFREGPMVECRPLDHYIEHCQTPIDFLWCDAQGSEARVILGGYRTLMQTRYAIFEYYDTPLYEHQADLKGLVSFLPDFDLLGIYGENALFRNKTLR